MGHKCELATNIATSTREELRSLSKKLGDHYDTIKKARKKVIDAKDSILYTQDYVRNRIVKHMGVLRACISRRETMLKCDVDERTTRKTKPLDEQERYGKSCIKVMHLSMSSPRRGGGGSGNPQEFDCDVYPQGGDFDHFDRSSTKSRRKINHTFDHRFLPGGGDFDIFF